MQSRILVVGAGGLLGRALASPGVVLVPHEACDVTLSSHRERLLARHRPEAIIFCAAISAVDGCEHLEHAHRVNVDAPAAWARRAPLWLVSSNYVFSGRGPHRPDSPRAPLQEYGRQKKLAEDAVLSAGGHVVRTGWLFGPHGRNWASRLPDLLKQGRVPAVTDWRVQPTWAPDLAQLLRDLPQGVSHAVGREETSWFEFATRLASLMGLPDRVTPVLAADLHLEATRPADARLSPALLPGWRGRVERLLR